MFDSLSISPFATSPDAVPLPPFIQPPAPQTQQVPQNTSAGKSYTGPYGWSATGLASGFSRDPNNPGQYFFQDQSGRFLGNPMSYDQLGNYFDLTGDNAGSFKYGPQPKEFAPGIQNFNYNPRGYYTGPGKFNLINPDVNPTVTGNPQQPNFSGGPDWTKQPPQSAPALPPFVRPQAPLQQPAPTLSSLAGIQSQPQNLPVATTPTTQPQSPFNPAVTNSLASLGVSPSPAAPPAAPALPPFVRPQNTVQPPRVQPLQGPPGTIRTSTNPFVGRLQFNPNRFNFRQQQLQQFRQRQIQQFLASIYSRLFRR